MRRVKQKEKADAEKGKDVVATGVTTGVGIF